MQNQAVEAPFVTFSITVYRWLLIAYPARFRREYGSHMLQVFRDCCLRASHKNRTSAIASFWAITLLDLTRSALQQHLQKEAHMSRSQFIRVSGAALILSSLAYLGQNISLGGWLICSVLLAIGILGLRLRYGASAGAFGRSVLLAGVIGMFLVYAVFAIVYVGQTYLGWTRFEGSFTFNPDSLWVLLFGGPSFPLLALTLFGISALRNRPMARFNWLPLATGIWFPILYSFAAAYIFTHHGTFPDRYWNAIGPLLLLQFLTLCLLGAALIFDKAREMAPA